MLLLVKIRLEVAEKIGDNNLLFDSEELALKRRCAPEVESDEESMLGAGTEVVVVHIIEGGSEAFMSLTDNDVKISLFVLEKILESRTLVEGAADLDDGDDGVKSSPCEGAASIF